MAKADGRVEARPFLSNTPKFRSGEDSPRAYLDRCLAAIDKHEATIKAFVTMDRAGALAAADAASKRWKAGKPLSPIDGMPVGIKDVIETANMPTQMGSPLYEGFRSERDSASVYALKEAGAVIVGKTVTTEFAATEPGPTTNPWDTARTPGGSSSGSAAGVAAGYFPAALGTQVVGSILRPASYCGVIGFKPTFGAINRGGSHDHMSQSAQGVLAASLADAWAVLRAIADRTGGDAGHPGLFGPSDLPAPKTPHTLALIETSGWADASDSAKAALEGAVSRLKAAGIRVARRADMPAVENVEQALGEAMLLTRKINAWESRWPLNTYRDRDATKLSKGMVERAGEAEAMTLDEFRGHLEGRRRMREIYARLGTICDGAITLSAPGEAPVGLKSTGNPTFVVPGSALGVPAISLPLLACNGLPLGLQILGFEHRDADLLAVAGAVEGIVGTGAAVKA